MILVPQLRRTVWSADGIEVVSVIRASGRVNGGPPLYTLEVFGLDKVYRMRNVEDALAMEAESYLALSVLYSLGGITL